MTAARTYAAPLPPSFERVFTLHCQGTFSTPQGTRAKCREAVELALTERMTKSGIHFWEGTCAGCGTLYTIGGYPREGA